MYLKEKKKQPNISDYSLKVSRDVRQWENHKFVDYIKKGFGLLQMVPTGPHVDLQVLDMTEEACGVQVH